MHFEKVTETEGREFVKTVLQKDNDTNNFLGHNYELLCIDGISENTIQEIIEGIVDHSIGKFRRDNDDLENTGTIYVGNEAGELIAVVKRMYFYGSCILINRIILPDPDNKYPWDIGCDPRYRRQWTLLDEYKYDAIMDAYKFISAKGIRYSVE